jgi:hypothetical protein
MEFLILEILTTATGHNVVSVRGIYITDRQDGRGWVRFEILFIASLLRSTSRANVNCTPNGDVRQYQPSGLSEVL